MSNKVIQIYEHQSLKTGETRNGVTFSERHLQILEKFRGNKDDSDFPYYTLIHHGVKFKQYVGVLCVGDLQIEVLPKIDNSTTGINEWRKYLLDMLKVAYKLKVNITMPAEQQLIHSPILDVFLQKFLDEVETLLHRGLIRTYRRVEENCNTLKGRLIFSKHIIKNLVHKERFYVERTTYDRNHICNRILYKVLTIIPDVTRNGYIRCRANSMAFQFPELNDITIDESTFSRLKFDRKTEDYSSAIEIAKLILLQYMPSLSGNDRREQALALMFDMNKLWEEYVLTQLRRRLHNHIVKGQEIKLFWEGDSGTKTIRPDIVIEDKKGNCVMVLDTKWKCPKDNKPSDNDLKQMFVYSEYWNTQRTCLVYPHPEVSGWSYKNGKFSNVCGSVRNKSCWMLYIGINRLR